MMSKQPLLLCTLTGIFEFSCKSSNLTFICFKTVLHSLTDIEWFQMKQGFSIKDFLTTDIVTGQLYRNPDVDLQIPNEQATSGRGKENPQDNMREEP